MQLPVCAVVYFQAHEKAHTPNLVLILYNKIWKRNTDHHGETWNDRFTYKWQLKWTRRRTLYEYRVEPDSSSVQVSSKSSSSSSSHEILVSDVKESYQKFSNMP